MLDPEDLHAYQVHAINTQLMNPSSFLALDMGLGKSSCTLTTIAHLIKHGAIRAALILAPLRICQSTWHNEAKKWSHLQHLKFSFVLGNEKQRLRALFTPADIYLCNVDNTAWLSDVMHHYFIDKGTLLNVDCLILDESTRYKNVNTKRFKALQPLLPYMKYKSALSGTPATNGGYADLYGQYASIGWTGLGTNYYSFLNSCFRPSGFEGRQHTVTEEGKAFIERNIAPITLQLSAADYLELPDKIINDIYVDLKPKHRLQYDELETLLMMELDSGTLVDIESNPTAKWTKCIQYASGSMITNTETGEFEKAHDTKLEALEDIIEESNGNPILLAYNYKSQAAMVQSKYPWAVNLTGLSGEKFNQTIEDWKCGKIQILMAHPASVAFGVDGLQKGGNVMVWMGAGNPSVELTSQMEARLFRQGQDRPTIIHRIIARDTLDEAIKMSLESKFEVQKSLTDALREYRIHRGI